MKTKEIVEKYFEYINSSSWDKWLSLFHDDVVVDDQLKGRIVGVEELSRVIEGRKNNKYFRNYPLEFVIDDNIAVVLWNMQAVRPDGTLVSVVGANFFRVSDGKIHYFSNFHDTNPFKSR